MCPLCHNRVEKHCIDSPTCDLDECRACNSYGTRDRRRWFRRL